MLEMDFKKGLLTAIAQDAETGEVLMVAFMNEEAFQKTVTTGQAHYYSRSRGKLWLKGETSGHIQEVEEVLVDCDLDAVVMKVRQSGAACHKGYRTCFFRKVEGEELVTVGEKVFDPDEVYGDK
ncbi:phosphoribosyl-AMP cyclohydrolase [Planctomycetota bacterium]